MLKVTIYLAESEKNGAICERRESVRGSKPATCWWTKLFLWMITKTVTKNI